MRTVFIVEKKRGGHAAPFFVEQALSCFFD